MSEPKPQAVVELEGVDVVTDAAPEVIVVREVNWRIVTGDFWVVAGEQGCGKTALLATAASLQRPAGGVVRIFGRALTEATEAEQVNWRRRMGFVFERSGRLFSHLMLAENVALPLQYHLNLTEVEALAKARELLARVGLENRANALPSGVAPRLQQRVALLRALAVPTQVLFLDDPLSGLDFGGACWWLNFLRELRTQHEAAGNPLTIVATADDFRGWLGLAQQFAVIEQQRFRVLGGRNEAAASGFAAWERLVATN